tara:strand:+ start:5988 stop:7130 length:1143 start_codon:yes stop_codon:yes gene_type:complete
MKKFIPPLQNINWSINSKEKIDFNISYTQSILADNNIIDSLSSTGRVFLFIDENIGKIYRKEIENIVIKSRKKYYLHFVKPDEENKNLNSVVKIIEFIDAQKLSRLSEPLITIGGGVVLDIVSFAASIYRRGVPIIKIPTNLLSIVDACVGVKTGINFGLMRNRIGTYYPPKKVLIDKNFLKTCPNRHISNGLGEIFKIALIKSSDLFNDLESYAFNIGIKEKLCYGALASKIINQSISLMLEELEPNLFEKNLERCVDFGHSISPIIELKNVDTLLHGEAVTLDCLFFSCLSYKKGFLQLEDLKKVYSLVREINLPIFHKDFTNKELIYENLEQTKAHRNGNLNLPIPNKIGSHLFLNEIKENEINESIEIFSEFYKEI